MFIGNNIGFAIKRAAAFLFCVVFICMIFTPAHISAKDTDRVVRVGCHEAPYFITDENGRRSGYTYDYQQKIAAYTGWTYEYVEGSWTELLEMLKKGEIDMMGNISYMDERTKDILYASLPMGTEAYYLFAAPNSNKIKADDYTSLNGDRVGVAKGSIQSELFREWVEERGLNVEIIEMTGAETDSMSLIGIEYDAYVTMDVHADNKVGLPMWKIGSSDFFFAISKSAPDLLGDLNYAMNRIQDENQFFSQQLYEQYLKNTETDRYVSETEKAWLDSHGPIRIGYQDNYLAFCSSDEKGELTGALKDYLEYASTVLENAELEFETVCYPNTASAIEALKNGEIDCVFPANMEYQDSEELGVVMTPSIMSTEMEAVVRAADQKAFIQSDSVTVAVNEGNTNYDLFLEKNFPNWQPKYYVNTLMGLNAVATGEADCVVISNYRFSNISKQCEKLRLTTINTGVTMDYYFAIRKGETDLYSIFSRVITSVPDYTVHTALTYYSAEDVKTNLFDNIKDHLFVITTVIALIIAVIMFLLFWGIRAEKRILEEERMVNVLNRKVYVDALTAVKNKRAFSAGIQELQDELSEGKKTEFAIAMLDCDDLKSVNDKYGHEKGDEYLKTASLFICHIFEHSPVYRIGGDEFAVILKNEDFDNREELLARFEKEKKERSGKTDNIWEQVRISIGIADYDPDKDTSVKDTVGRADKNMYKNKRVSKGMKSK